MRCRFCTASALAAVAVGVSAASGEAGWSADGFEGAAALPVIDAHVREYALRLGSLTFDDPPTTAVAPTPTHPQAGESAIAPPPSGGDSGSEELAKKLQNPVADLISVPLQFNYDDGYGPKDGGRYTLNIQPVIPISISDEWNLISRTILPVIDQQSTADGIDSDFGLGDVTQSLFFSPKEPVGGWILGFGPVALLPTGTSPRLRNEQLALGPTVVALRQEHGWTYGILANHLWAVTDSDDHETINASFIQPFISHTWPSATSLTLNSETTYDWTQHEATVPINLMLSQLVRIGKQPVNFQIGGRYYADSPDGGPEWGIRFAITFLFPK